MERLTIKRAILNYLAPCSDWQSGGVIGGYVGNLLKMKSSNIERRCRELCEEGKIQRDIQPNSSGKKVVYYRLPKDFKAIAKSLTLHPEKMEKPAIKQEGLGLSFMKKYWEES